MPADYHKVVYLNKVKSIRHSMTLLIGSEMSLARALYRALCADEVGNAHVRIAVTRPY